MKAQIEHLELEAQKLVKNPMLALVKLPALLAELFGLLHAIVNHLEEQQK